MTTPVPAAGRRAPDPPLQALLGVVASGRTYASLLYLLLCFPLGLAYVVVLGFGAVAGAVLAIAGVGLLILVACLVIAWGFAMFERELAIWLLETDVPPMSVPGPRPRSGWGRLAAHLRQPVTWKSLAFLVLKLPVGLLATTAIGIPLSASVGLVVVPIVFVLQSFERVAFNPPLTAACLASMLVGLFLLVVTLHAANWVGRACGALAGTMLGVGDEERQLWEAQRRAEAAERSRRELILNVSHELRTPIASILGHVETLLQPPGDRPAEATPERYLPVVASETRRLGALVDDLLDLARADSHELAVLVRPVELGPVARGVVDAIAPMARRDRRVTLALAEPVPVVAANADPERLAQVLTNLVRNAVNHTPEGGAVLVQVGEPAPDDAWVDVSDTGPGIPAGELERIFERFYRTDRSRARDSGGFGLGLSIARELAVAMGGDVTARSEVGTGSTFRVTLRRAG
jgi:two-component system phosphate regulon sensor histidine kinase PhoR